MLLLLKWKCRDDLCGKVIRRVMRKVDCALFNSSELKKKNVIKNDWYRVYYLNARWPRFSTPTSTPPQFENYPSANYWQTCVTYLCIIVSVALYNLRNDIILEYLFNLYKNKIPIQYYLVVVYGVCVQADLLEYTNRLKMISFWLD